MLRGLSTEGTAILLTTHYLDEAAQLAQRVGVLSGGVIAEEAPPAELGGAEARTPIVRWRDSAGTAHEQRTRQPGELVARLVAEAAAAGGAGGTEPAELEIVCPGLAAIGFEVRGYFRQPDAVFFTFLFPVLMLATDVTREKLEGWLRRLGGTPFTPAGYFIGKAGLVLITSLLQVALLLAVARFAFGVELPGDPALWLRFSWLFLLGMVTMSLLGIALSALPRSSRSAVAVVLPPLLILQFISGVYIQFTMLPEWLQNIAAVFPLKWLAQGMRSVFLPEHFAAAEPSGGWDIGLVALNLAIWLVVGLVLSLVTFRWLRES